MKRTTKTIIKKLIEKEVRFLGFGDFDFVVEKPKEKEHGDYATNAALQIAKKTKKNPLEIAELLKNKLQNLSLFEKIEVIKPGFINFFLSKEYLQKQLMKIDKTFGELKIGRGKRVNIEFVSANPTGPLTLGNGRGGFFGDVLANLLEKAGFSVVREYYINDAGEQIKKLGHSVLGDSQAVYSGKYINTLRERIKEKDPQKAGEIASKIILEEMIKSTLKRLKIRFDVWFSEKKLYETNEVEKTIKILNKKGLVYEKEGALWFKSTKFGDDKDRVLKKADGQYTYFASDIAYLRNKFKRGFKKLIFVFGADHHGYIKRMKSAIMALGKSPDCADFILFQVVFLYEKGKKIKMSKRAGTFVTLDELVDRVGLDVARFFFLERSFGNHLKFNMDLAIEKSERNPVFYVQYAYARICSILRKSKKNVSFKSRTKKSQVKLLNHPSELMLIKQLLRFPEIIEDIAKDYHVHRLPQYAIELATYFHRFYRDCRVLADDKELLRARLFLVLAVKYVLKNTLNLMGISAPEKM